MHGHSSEETVSETKEEESKSSSHLKERYKKTLADCKAFHDRSLENYFNDIISGQEKSGHSLNMRLLRLTAWDFKIINRWRERLEKDLSQFDEKKDEAPSSLYSPQLANQFYILAICYEKQNNEAKFNEAMDQARKLGSYLSYTAFFPQWNPWGKKIDPNNSTFYPPNFYWNWIHEQDPKENLFHSAMLSQLYDWQLAFSYYWNAAILGNAVAYSRIGILITRNRACQKYLLDHWSQIFLEELKESAQKGYDSGTESTFWHQLNNVFQILSFQKGNHFAVSEFTLEVNPINEALWVYSAEAGNYRAAEKLAEAFSKSPSVDLEKAFKYAEMAADNGSAKCAFIVAEKYRTGANEVKKNLEKALHYYSKSDLFLELKKTALIQTLLYETYADGETFALYCQKLKDSLYLTHKGNLSAITIIELSFIFSSFYQIHSYDPQVLYYSHFLLMYMEELLLMNSEELGSSDLVALPQTSARFNNRVKLALKGKDNTFFSFIFEDDNFITKIGSDYLIRILQIRGRKCYELIIELIYHRYDKNIAEIIALYYIDESKEELDLQKKVTCILKIYNALLPKKSCKHVLPAELVDLPSNVALTIIDQCNAGYLLCGGKYNFKDSLHITKALELAEKYPDYEENPTQHKELFSQLYSYKLRNERNFFKNLQRYGIFFYFSRLQKEYLSSDPATLDDFSKEALTKRYGGKHKSTPSPMAEIFYEMTENLDHTVISTTQGVTAKSWDDQQTVNVFLKIHQALLEGQSGLTYSTLPTGLQNRPASKALAIIKEHAEKKGTRSEKALQLTIAFLHDQGNDTEKYANLLAEIYHYSFAHSGPFKQSKHFGTSFYSAASLKKYLDNNPTACSKEHLSQFSERQNNINKNCFFKPSRMTKIINVINDPAVSAYRF